MKMRCPLLFPHLAPMPPPRFGRFRGGSNGVGTAGPRGLLRESYAMPVNGRNLAVSAELHGARRAGLSWECQGERACLAWPFQPAVCVLVASGQRSSSCASWQV